MSVIDDILYTSVAGEKESLNATVYSLSTCAFCRRGMEYLNANNVAYRYVQLDKLDFEVKRQVKEELKNRYGDLPVFPVLTVWDTVAVSGYATKRWAEVLEIEDVQE